MKPVTENLLLVYEDVALRIPPAAEAPPGSTMTRETYTELFTKVVEEVSKGVCIAPHGVSIAARKKAVM